MNRVGIGYDVHPLVEGRKLFLGGVELAHSKGLELAANPTAALVFHWKSLRRQVRVRGPVETVGPAEADAYQRVQMIVPRLAEVIR